ncbi:MAG: hypothetical protein IPJ04_05020 [Candidatus Eisenbacteria bacterium]|nr:hypothetical protein [Candidatus Eisenbacteria bacterium]
MRKGTRVLAAAALALMVPVLAAASTARMSGLNVPGDYVKGDYTGMYTYLSEVNTVGNLAYVEAGSYDRGLTDHAIGAVLPGLFDGKYGVWSFHLRQTHPALGQSSNFAPISTGHDSEDPNYAGEAFDIIWGHKMGNGNLALRLNRSFESYDDGTDVEEGDGNNGRNILGFGGGYGWDMNANTQVEIGVLYQQRSFDEGPTGNADNGGTNMLVAARAFRKASGNLTLIPAVKYWSQDQSYTDNETTTNYDAKYSGYQAGIAGNWTVGSDDLLVFGANLAQNKGDFGDGNEFTQTFMPNVFMALETHLNPWLTFRAGAQNAMFYSYTEKFTGGEEKWKEHYFTFNLGTTVKLGNLVLDATLDPAFLQNPFAQLMGGQNAFYYNSYYGPGRVDGGPVGFVFPNVSATYTW